MVEKEIKAHFFRKRVISYATLILVFMSAISVFFNIKQGYKSDKILDAQNAQNKSNSDEIRTNQPKPFNRQKKEQNKNMSFYNKKEFTIEKTFRTINGNKKLRTKYKNGPISKNAYLTDIKGVREMPISDSMSKGVKTNNLIFESSTSQSNKIEYSDIILKARLFSFQAISANINVRPNKTLDYKKRKFAITLELENITSMRSKNKLNGLSQEQSVFRDKYEDFSNSNNYSISIMLQPGRVGFITGLGFNSSNITTNYLTDTNHFHLIEKTITHYQIIRDSIPNSGRYYSHILIYDDTIKVRSEQLKGQTNQNHFKWMMIPLKISYQYPHNRLRLSVRAGLDLMWLYHFQGSLINKNLDGVVKIGELEHQVKRFNANASTQIMAGYMLNRKIQIGGSIYYSHQIGSNFITYKSRFQNLGYGYYLRYSL